MLVGTGAAQAAALVDLQILGSKTQGSGYTSSVNGVNAGDTVYLEIVGQLAPISTSNATKSVTITSLTGSDGISSLKFDLSATSGTFSNIGLAKPGTTPAANIDWSLGLGGSAGAIGTGAVTGVRPAANAGVYDAATSQDVIWYGQLTAGSTSSTVSALWNGSGAFHINGGTNITINAASETSADHLVSFAPLTVSVPEPASLGLAGVAVLGLMARRRRQV